MEINKPIFIILTLMITLIIFFLFVFPKYQESLNLKKELEEKQAQYEGRVDYDLKISEILKGIEQKQDILEKVNSALPSNFNIAPELYFFQGKAKEAGLTIESITFYQPERAEQVLTENYSKKVKNITFKIELLGDYQGLKDFLSSLEKSARLFEVNSIAFAASSLQGPGRLQNKLQSYNFIFDIETHAY